MDYIKPNFDVNEFIDKYLQKALKYISTFISHTKKKE